MSSPQPAPVILRFLRMGKGSGVTRVEALRLPQSAKEELLSAFKRRFACGGAVKEGRIEVQGDRRCELEAELRAKGYAVRRAGG